MTSLNEIKEKIERLSNPVRAEACARYFKTGVGQYGHGDKFLGLSMPQLRSLAKEYRVLEIDEVTELLCSHIHEERMLALLIFVGAYSKGNESLRQQIYDTYLAHTRFINNWDLVDSSAPQIVGFHLLDKSRRPLYVLAKSKSLWERRISIMATFQFIRRDDYAEALKISELLLADKDDLIHKATGWMLREIGKRDLKVLKEFLNAHYRQMPRTMLRYAIERFPEEERRKYLKAN